MPTITINDRTVEFKPGEVILAAANRAGVEIPQYCYHPGLSIVASCRICLGEVWMPNPRNNNRLEPWMGGKLLPTCQTAAADGMVVYTTTPKAIANQKAVMEYLLINHPLDCPVCDQAGECLLQDYSYEYGRSVSRFEETKVKQPKKDLGPHVYLYADRCIMCSRCVRFTREVSGTGELCVTGRGNREEIDVFPGTPLDNELSANVVDLCPVGALLDKDFLFAQRVWFLKSTPSIDGITASGDNILVEHNEGRVYRLKPRTNMRVNQWWISDEIRYGWKFVHDPARLGTARVRQFGVQVQADYARALGAALDGLRAATRDGARRLALVVSPMLACEEAFLLARAARAIDPHAVLALGPVPVSGEDRTYPPNAENGYRVYAEKAPNARGVRRVLEAVAGTPPLEYRALVDRLAGGNAGIGAVILTANYPSDWATDEFARALAGTFLVLVDTLSGRLADQADVLLPGATWVEKAGTFENARAMIQAFEQAIPVHEGAKSEGQIALDLELLARTTRDGAPPVLPPVGRAPTGDQSEGGPESLDIPIRETAGPLASPAAAERTQRFRLYNAADVRRAMAAASPALAPFIHDVESPELPAQQQPDMAVVEL